MARRRAAETMLLERPPMPLGLSDAQIVSEACQELSLNTDAPELQIHRQAVVGAPQMRHRARDLWLVFSNRAECDLLIFNNK